MSRSLLASSPDNPGEPWGQSLPAIYVRKQTAPANTPVRLSGARSFAGGNLEARSFVVSIGSLIPLPVRSDSYDFRSWEVYKMNRDANAPFQYLATCSKVSLESFEMSELNKASMRRKEALEVLDAWIEAEVNARLARWVLEHRRRDPNVCIDSMVKIDETSALPVAAPP